MTQINSIKHSASLCIAVETHSPFGSYLESGSCVKVRVELATPLVFSDESKYKVDNVGCSYVYM